MLRKRFLVFLFILSFLIRALVFQFFLSKNDNFWQVDSTTYHQVANGITSGWGISHEYEKPNFYRLPGYSLFLSIFYKLFGPIKTIALWFQIFLASFIPIFIFFLSLSLFPTNLLLAKIASIYSSVHLGFVLYSGFFMSESLFIFLFLLFAIFFFNFSIHPPSLQAAVDIYGKRWFNFFLSGLFLGLASLVRPVGHYFIILAIALILIFNSFGNKKFKSIFLLSLGWFIPVSFWLIRNFLLLHSIFFHTLPGGHFLYLSAARVAMHEQDCSYWQARENLQKESEILIKLKEQKLGHPLNEIEHCKLLESLAVKYFVKHPVLAIKNWFTDITRTTLSLYSAELIYLYNDRKEIDYFNKNRTTWDMFKRYLFPDVSSKLIKIILFFEILFFSFILLGLTLGFLKLFFLIFIYLVGFKSLTKKELFNIGTWFKVMPFIALFILLSLSGGYARMRLPAEPFLIILSFSFWFSVFRKGIQNNLDFKISSE